PMSASCEMLPASKTGCPPTRTACHHRTYVGGRQEGRFASCARIELAVYGAQQALAKFRKMNGKQPGGTPAVDARSRFCEARLAVIVVILRSYVRHRRCTTPPQRRNR